MPLYEYRCETCGAVFEVMQKFSDTPISIHEGCGGSVEKLISRSAIQFKGTGWYVTDYARKNGKSDSHVSKPAGENGSATKTESKEKPKEKPAKTESKPA